MELKLENGRYVPGRFGLETVSGHDELLQRITMKLKARRGEFYPLTDYGSRLHTLLSVKPANRSTAAKQYIQEALSGERDLTLESLDISYSADNELHLFAGFTYKGDDKLFVETEI